MAPKNPHQSPFTTLSSRHSTSPSLNPPQPPPGATPSPPSSLSLLSTSDSPAQHLTNSSPTTPDFTTLLPRRLYLTYNVPEVDDLHQGLYHHHPTASTPFSGTLYHAIKLPQNTPWRFESRSITDIRRARKSIALIFLLPPFTCSDTSDEMMKECLSKIFKGFVPVGREARERELGPLLEGEGNPELEGYDCKVWVRDALEKLRLEGVVRFGDLKIDEIIEEGKCLACPGDPREMVGKEHEARIVNKYVDFETIYG